MKKEMKPLSELVNDMDACFEIFKFITGEVIDGFSAGSDYILMTYKGNYKIVYVYFIGNISYAYREDSPSNFEVIDFIRSLGYDSVNEKIS